MQRRCAPDAKNRCIPAPCGKCSARGTLSAAPPWPPAPGRRRGTPPRGCAAAAGRCPARAAATPPRASRDHSPAPPRAPGHGSSGPSRGPPPARRAQPAAGAHQHHVVVGERQAVVGQPVLLDHVADHLAEHPPRPGRAGLLQQRLEPDPPLRLPAAVLARDLVDPPLQRLSQVEIVPVQRQHRLRHHRAVHPVRERHRDVDHPPAPGLAQDLPGVDQPEAARALDPAGGDVGDDPRPRQPLQRLAQPPVAVAARSRGWWRARGRAPSSCSTGLVGRPSFSAAISWLTQ